MLKIQYGNVNLYLCYHETNEFYRENISFWKEIKNINPVNKILPNVVDNKQGTSDIIKVFVNKYQSLYTSVPTNDIELCSIYIKYMSLLYNYVKHDVQCITPSTVSKCMLSLKKHKSDGGQGFNSNHLIYGGNRLNIIVSLLFNVMLTHGYYPSELLKSTIISLPKDNTASLSSSDNYRGISLFNSICKLFDYIIIDMCGDVLSTSDMQFGFKKQHSTTMCSVILKEVVSHYIEGNSNVYCCLLDASKAFDKIHYGKLFRVLLDKHISPLVLRLLMNCYVRQCARVSWDNVMSEYFILSNGVKQGGVLSPKLFTVYIDSLLDELKQSGYGCYLNDVFVGALSYADDITLLCPSLRGLNKMLDICSHFAELFNITFNNKKTVCIKFGEILHEWESAHLNNNKLSWVDKIKHLGNHIDSTLNDDLDCKSKISTFIGFVNKLQVNFGHLQNDVLCTLFKSYCCSFYGCQLWRIDSCYFTKVCTAWNIGVRKIFNLPYQSHRWLLGPLLGQPHISVQLHKRSARFLYVMKHCSNNIVNACFKQACQNANSPIGHNIAYLRNIYGVDIKHHSINVCMSHIRSRRLSGDQLVIIRELRTLLSVRSGVYYINDFTVSDVTALIKCIST